MKNLKMIIIIVSLFNICIYSQTARTDNKSWDKKLIAEAPIWKNLLVHYMNAEYSKYWTERKAALENIVWDYPNSNWADDAALLLAGGKASVERDISGAIRDLRGIIKKYPNGASIVDRWDMNSGFRLNEGWMMWVPGLIKYDSIGNYNYPLKLDNKYHLKKLINLLYEKEKNIYIRL